jgi:hypothetical protein
MSPVFAHGLGPALDSARMIALLDPATVLPLLAATSVRR